MLGNESFVYLKCLSKTLIFDLLFRENKDLNITVVQAHVISYVH